MFSAIVPAYNEAASIADCLSPLADLAEQTGGEVIVVCNGCHDQTAEIARTFNGVQVIETSVASKVYALNLGDEAATQFPRVYIDADLKISVDSLTHLVKSADVQVPRLVSPRMKMDMQGVALLVRLFTEFWTSLPAYPVRTGGCYAVSQTGRERFEQFPELSADDTFVRAQFSNDEVLHTDHAVFIAKSPRTLTGLINIRKRVKRGNSKLIEHNQGGLGAPQNSSRAVISAAFRSPRSFAGGLVFCGLTLWVWTTLKLERSADVKWDRDESSRTEGNA